MAWAGLASGPILASGQRLFDAWRRDWLPVAGCLARSLHPEVALVLIGLWGKAAAESRMKPGGSGFGCAGDPGSTGFSTSP